MKTIELLEEMATGLNVIGPIENFVTGMKAMQRDLPDIIDSGEINPLHAAVIIKAMEDTAKVLRANILVKDAVREELEKYAEKTVKFGTYTFNKREVGTSYDFSGCNDPILTDNQEKADYYTALVKANQEMLKKLPAEGMDTYNPLTGEAYKIYPPVKKSESGYAISFEK